MDENTQKPARRRRRFRRRRKQRSPYTPIFEFQPSKVVVPHAEDSYGEECELHTYERRYDSRGEVVVLRVGTTDELELPRDKSHKAALILHREYDERQELQKTYLEIRSRHIKSALKEIISTYPGHNFDTDRHIYMSTPPKPIFYYRKELAEYAQNHQHDLARKHINLCLRYLHAALEAELPIYEERVLSSKEPAINFSNLWMVFKPGILIYTSVEGNDVVCRLRRVESKPSSLTLFMEKLVYNGKMFGFSTWWVGIRAFDGYLAIRELQAFPLSLHREQESIRRRLVERGRKYCSLYGIHHRYYEGTARLFNSPYSSREPVKNMRHRFIIDAAEFEAGSQYPLEFIPNTKVIDPDTQDHLALGDDDLIITDLEVVGYSLEWRAWAFFNVENIREVPFNTTAFRQLVFPEHKKNIIESLVQQQQQDQAGGVAGFDDLIQGKGQGLIFLLHGPPGVESIADHTKRPLLPISSGELIGHPEDVENKLSKVLSLAKRWNALVLIDEADVFMQERQISDLDRNSLVSILLRVLEYFDGTLFLTTNRVHTIDRAFRSRVHLSLAYPPLSEEAQKQVWHINIQRACSGQSPPWLSERLQDRLVKSNLNGREIKNIVRMAYAIAQNQQRALAKEDIELSIDCYSSFDIEFNQKSR